MVDFKSMTTQELILHRDHLLDAWEHDVMMVSGMELASEITAKYLGEIDAAQNELDTRPDYDNTPDYGFDDFE